MGRRLALVRRKYYNLVWRYWYYQYLRRQYPIVSRFKLWHASRKWEDATD